MDHEEPGEQSCVPRANNHCTAEPEAELLMSVLRDSALTSCLARAPGGWRTLSEHELRDLGLVRNERRAVLALQELVRTSYPELSRHRPVSSVDIGRVYGARLGGLVTEVMIAIALDGRNNVIGETQIASGGAHGLGVTARDILRPLVRIGASAFVLTHNHPSGNPSPSGEDVVMTRVLAAAGDVVGIPLVDHVVVGARGGGHASLLDLGLLDYESSDSTEAHRGS